MAFNSVPCNNQTTPGQLKAAYYHHWNWIPVVDELTLLTQIHLLTKEGYFMLRYYECFPYIILSLYYLVLRY